MNAFSYLLYPFGLLFQTITFLRRFAYERGRKGATFPVPLILVGNLSTGGTGKTPFSNYLLHLLSKQNMSPALISRGYGRKSTGFLELNLESKAEQVGDEPLLLKMKNAFCPIAVCENRAIGIGRLLKTHPETKTIVMDDGYQHFTVRPKFRILLMNYSKPYWEDAPLPAGHLREGLRAASYANAFVVTKCSSNISLEKQAAYKQRIATFTKAPVFFSTIQYDDIDWKINKELNKSTVVALSAIANAAPFEEELKRRGYEILSKAYPDHHLFKKTEVQTIVSFAKSKCAAIVCTEKDFVKLKEWLPLFKNQVPFGVLPITMAFINHDTAFDALLLQSLDAGINKAS